MSPKKPKPSAGEPADPVEETTVPTPAAAPDAIPPVADPPATDPALEGPPPAVPTPAHPEMPPPPVEEPAAPELLGVVDCPTCGQEADVRLVDKTEAQGFQCCCPKGHKHTLSLSWSEKIRPASGDPAPADFHGGPHVIGQIDCSTCGGPATVHEDHPSGKGGLYAVCQMSHEAILGESWRDRVRPIAA